MSWAYSVMMMSKAKDHIVQHNKKGAVKLGTLSHNELCRAVVDLLEANKQLQEMLDDAYKAYTTAKENQKEDESE